MSKHPIRWDNAQEDIIIKILLFESFLHIFETIPDTSPTDIAPSVIMKFISWNVNGFRAVLDMDLPFEKIGLAHLTTCLVCVPYDNAHNVLKLVSNEDYYDLFSRSAKIGVGIELNHGDFISQSPELYAESVRAFRIAKEAGCKFYLGSDAHAPAGFTGYIETLERIISDLDLTEDDKLDIVRR